MSQEDQTTALGRLRRSQLAGLTSPFFEQCLWWGHQGESMLSTMGRRQRSTLHLFLLMTLLFNFPLF